ncbi:MAG: dTMP kinase [Candidatus Wallbacteria bacterium HGW-Wallbacteria-1]|jgi:dTMP kinase|uniref:Thymidylate kinase n=1 Tax=Candidatus Wallbacteria bacterium HGW-Wallbacteria-1 TaxID=2013854 RepID=A0A2N1PUS4_9BACT|nr:MAG: dTMP kinase [Candidatus Wallbacteria bacterium HGW-Wallbacteria-1]
MNRGLFITFEGPEGSGKSTQSKKVQERIAARGIQTRWTREPGGTPLGDKIRSILIDPENGGMADLTEVLLLAAGRNEHVDKVIAPGVEEGKVIVCDRFADSTLAYQGYGRGVSMDHLRYLHGMVTKGLAPDLTILVDIESERGLARVKSRGEVQGGDRIEREEIDFHRRLRSGYLEMAGNYPERYEIVDGDRSLDEVFEDILTRLEKRFELFRGKLL